MIRHVVMWRFEEFAEGKTRQQNMEYIRDRLMALPSIIPEIIPGIEFSTEYEGRDIHILGLDIDYKNKSFIQVLRWLRSENVRRMEKKFQGIL